jgi:hypothetical protein
LSILLFIVSLNNLFVIKWLTTFSSEISIWNWAILLFFSSIVIQIWSILLKNEYNTKQNIILNDSQKIQEIDEKKSMKLPF